MKRKSVFIGLAVLLMAGTAGAVLAADAPATPAAATTSSTATSTVAIGANIPERSEGRADAPVTVQEFVSFTCPHCAAFYNEMLPGIEKNYVETGKVRIIMRDFPIDGLGLKAAALARCMPQDMYFPFVKTLFKNQVAWATAQDPEKILVQYAGLGGLPEDKAKACLNDKGMQDAIVEVRSEAEKKYTINATPTFIFNEGQAKLEGIGSPDQFTAAADKILAAQKK